LNKLNLKYCLLIGVLLSGILTLLPAQENTEPATENYLNTDEWKKISEKTDYTEKFKEPKKRDKKPRELKPRNKQKKSKSPVSFMQFLKVALIVIIIGVLSFLIFLILKRFFNFFEEKVSSGNIIQVIESLEDNLHEADIDKLLRQALELQEYKLAVRILYLKTIKLLTDCNIISWKKDKTNARYVSEMYNHKLGKHFAFLTRVYEQAWFSSYEIDVNRFKLISDEFNVFFNKIN